MVYPNEKLWPVFLIRHRYKLSPFGPKLLHVELYLGILQPLPLNFQLGVKILLLHLMVKVVQVEDEKFIQSIKGIEKVSHTTFEDGVKYMEFTEAVTRSSQSGEKIYLPL